ncbi:MAG: Prolyl endopeptidase, partial [uncultured Acidimicrobiales bacterium]
GVSLRHAGRDRRGPLRSSGGRSVPLARGRGGRLRSALDGRAGRALRPAPGRMAGAGPSPPATGGADARRRRPAPDAGRPCLLPPAAAGPGPGRVDGGRGRRLGASGPRPGSPLRRRHRRGAVGRAVARRHPLGLRRRRGRPRGGRRPHPRCRPGRRGGPAAPPRPGRRSGLVARRRRAVRGGNPPRPARGGAAVPPPGVAAPPRPRPRGSGARLRRGPPEDDLLRHRHQRRRSLAHRLVQPGHRPTQRPVPVRPAGGTPGVRPRGRGRRRADGGRGGRRRQAVALDQRRRPARSDRPLRPLCSSLVVRGGAGRPRRAQRLGAHRRRPLRRVAPARRLRRHRARPVDGRGEGGGRPPGPGLGGHGRSPGRCRERAVAVVHRQPHADPRAPPRRRPDPGVGRRPGGPASRRRPRGGPDVRHLFGRDPGAPVRLAPPGSAARRAGAHDPLRLRRLPGLADARLQLRSAGLGRSGRRLRHRLPPGWWRIRRGLASRRHARRQAARLRRLPGLCLVARGQRPHLAGPPRRGRRQQRGAAGGGRPHPGTRALPGRPLLGSAARHGALRAVRPRHHLERRVRHGRGPRRARLAPLLLAAAPGGRGDPVPVGALHHLRRRHPGRPAARPQAVRRPAARHRRRSGATPGAPAPRGGRRPWPANRVADPRRAGRGPGLPRRPARMARPNRNCQEL